MSHANDPVDTDEIPGGTRRGHILDEDAIAAIYARPQFTAEEREACFTLNAAETTQLQQLREPHTRLFFLLQLGYFHAKQRFFTFTLDKVQTDAAYLCERYRLAVDLADPPVMVKPTIRRQCAAICRLSGYRESGPAERQLIRERAAQTARISSNPTYVAEAVLDYLSTEQIIGPGYTVLQDLIRQSLTAEHRRLTAILETQLTAAERQQVDALLTLQDGRRPIIWLQRMPRDFAPRAMQDELARGEMVRPLAQRVATILPLLTISQGAIAHYAWLVQYYSFTRLVELDPTVRLLYLLCFIDRRYRRLNDHLIACFLHLVKHDQGDAVDAMTAQVATIEAALVRDLPKVGKILHLLATPQHAPETPLETIQQAAYVHLPAPRLAEVADQLRTRGRVDASAVYWTTVDRTVRRMKRRIRPLVQVLVLDASHPNVPILEAVQTVQGFLATGRPLTRVAHAALPARFIPVKERCHVYTTEADGTAELHRDRYEFLLYRQLRKALEAGEVFCPMSVQYRSFEDDLLSAEAWANKDTILAHIGEPRLLVPIQDQLALLEPLLEGRIRTVNRRIVRRDNPHVTIRHSKKRTT